MNELANGHVTPSGKELEAIQDNCYTGVTTKNIQLFSPTDDSSELMVFKQKKTSKLLHICYIDRHRTNEHATPSRMEVSQ